MRTVSIPEARKYCRERGWVFLWRKTQVAGSNRKFSYLVTASDISSLYYLEALHPSRQYAIQAVYEAVKLFEEVTLHTPSAYIKRTKTRPTRRAKNVIHP